MTQRSFSSKHFRSFLQVSDWRQSAVEPATQVYVLVLNEHSPETRQASWLLQ